MPDVAEKVMDFIELLEPTARSDWSAKGFFSSTTAAPWSGRRTIKPILPI
jgi:hypothetical protein